MVIIVSKIDFLQAVKLLFPGETDTVATQEPLKGKEKTTPERHVSFDSTNQSKADDLAYFRSRSLNSKAYQDLKSMPCNSSKPLSEEITETVEVRTQQNF